MADARFVIDVAAEMSGTETLGELDSLIDKLGVSGRKSEDFQAAVKRVSADLDAAAVAAAGTAAALAAGNEQYRELERVAVGAARALEKAQAAGKFDPRAARSAYEAGAALEAYSVDLKVLEGASAKATAEQAKLAKVLTNVNKIGATADTRYAALNQRFEKLGQAAQFLPGPLRNVAMGFVGANRAGFGLLHTLGAVRAAMLLTTIGAFALVGGFAAIAVAALKRIPAASMLIDELGANMKALFGDLNWSPLTRAFEVIIGFFDKANPLAEVFRIVGVSAFESLSEAVLASAYVLEAFAIEAAIAVLKTYLFFRKYGEEIEATLIGLGIAALAFGVYFAIVNASVIAGWLAFGVVAAATAATATLAWLAMALPAIAVIAAIAAVGYAIGQLILHWDEVVEGVKLIWSDLTAWLGEQVQWFTDLGYNLMMGLVAGITGSVSAVIGAVSSAVTGAIDAAKSVLGIASPSKVFGEIGGYTVEGFTGAVDAGAGEAQNSMAAMVDPSEAASTAPAAASSAAAAAPSAGAGGGKSVNLQGATLNFYGVKDAETHGRSMLIEAFTQMLEGDADSMSGAEVPA